jgi:hypothetical protein
MLFLSYRITLGKTECYRKQYIVKPQCSTISLSIHRSLWREILNCTLLRNTATLDTSPPSTLCKKLQWTNSDAVRSLVLAGDCNFAVLTANKSLGLAHLVLLTAYRIFCLPYLLVPHSHRKMYYLVRQKRLTGGLPTRPRHAVAKLVVDFSPVYCEM